MYACQLGNSDITVILKSGSQNNVTHLPGGVMTEFAESLLHAIRGRL